MTDEGTHLVPPAGIARLAGVSRAAVSNWRRRHADFPEPKGGTTSSPLFALDEVQAWLKARGKGQDVSDEVRLWNGLRTAFGDDLPSALVAVATILQGGKPDERLAEESVGLIRELAEAQGKAEFLDALTERFVASETRAGAEHVSTPALVRAVRHFAGETSGVVFDPACGVGDLFLAVGGEKVKRRYAQDSDARLIDFVQRRAAVTCSASVLRAEIGDSLRDDRWPDLKADLVVCDPPTGQTDWGRDDLLLDSRWELGLPPKAEGDLAWLQHCYFHTAPGGRAVVVLPSSAAYRRSGRRIRSELVRNSILHTMVALPGGSAAGHAQPVHLWILRRPEEQETRDAQIRMIDLTEASLETSVEPTDRQTAMVPALELLDDEVDLTPGKWVTGSQTDYAEAYEEARASFERMLRQLLQGLPPLSEEERQTRTPMVNVAELIQNGLVEIQDGEAVSRTEQLDTRFLRGFLESRANQRRSTSASGTHRHDPRSGRVPQMDIERQRRYGEVFDELENFLHVLDQAAKMGRQAARLARDGLTSGALEPPREQE